MSSPSAGKRRMDTDVIKLYPWTSFKRRSLCSPFSFGPLSTFCLLCVFHVVAHVRAERRVKRTSDCNAPPRTRRTSLRVVCVRVRVHRVLKESIRCFKLHPRIPRAIRLHVTRTQSRLSTPRISLIERSANVEIPRG